MLLSPHMRPLKVKSTNSESLYDLRVVPVFHWTFGPGRKFGCFDARPGVSYITYVEHSFEDVKMEYNYYSQQWDTSQARVELQEHMALIIKHNDLSNVVCFGTGSLQDDHMNVRRRTCLQIAAMVTMKDCISMIDIPYHSSRHTNINQ